MSITSLLKDDNEVKDQFSKYIRIPKIDKNYPIQAERINDNPPLVGQAFDYLMRFYLERKHPKEKVIKSRWVAYNSYHIVVNSYLKTFDKSPDDLIKLNKDRTLINDINLGLIHAQYEYVQYKKTGVLTDALLDRCIFLATLDELYRSKKFRYEINKPIDANEIQDLKNLYQVLESVPFEASKYLFLNPTFGMASILAKGADADFIFDDTLVDIKVYSKIESEREFLYQLVAYAMCLKIGGIFKTKKQLKINTLAIYFARHGALLKYPMDEVIAPDDFKNLTLWFYNHLKNGHQ